MLLRRLLGRGITVDLNWFRDAFNPSDHPHAAAGSGKGGQFVKKGEAGYAPHDTSVGFKKAEKDMRTLHDIANNVDLTPQEKAEMIKGVAGQKKSPYAMNYGNKLISWLELNHDLKKGELGKATAAPGASTGTGPSTKAPKAAKEAAEEPNYYNNLATSVSGYGTQAEKIAYLKKVVANAASPGLIEAAKAMLTGMESGSKSEEDEDSDHFKSVIHNSLAKFDSNADKINYLKGVASAAHAPVGIKEYAKQQLSELQNGNEPYSSKGAESDLAGHKEPEEPDAAAVANVKKEMLKHTEEWGFGNAKSYFEAFTQPGATVSAVTKAAAEAILDEIGGMKSTPSSPKPAKPLPELKTKADKSSLTALENYLKSNLPDEQKILTLKDYAKDKSAALKAHIDAKIETLENLKTPPPPPKPKKVTDLPAPYSGAKHQEDIHKAATGADTTEEQISKVKEAMAALPSGAQYAMNYGQSVLEALGDTSGMGSNSTAATPSKAAPKAKTKPGDTTVVSKASNTSAMLKRLEDAKSYYHDPITGVKNATPTADESWWNKAFKGNETALNYIKSYTGGGYAKVNQALRNPEDAAEGAHAAIHALNDAFEHEDAKLKEDVQLNRGTTLPAALVKQITMSLEKGLPTKFALSGFTSTSVSGGFSGVHILKILAKKGASALYVRPVSNHPHENEMLLNHHQSYTLHKFTRGADGNITFWCSID